MCKKKCKSQFLLSALLVEGWEIQENRYCLLLFKGSIMSHIWQEVKGNRESTCWRRQTHTHSLWKGIKAPQGLRQCVKQKTLWSKSNRMRGRRGERKNKTWEKGALKEDENGMGGTTQLTKTHKPISCPLHNCMQKSEKILTIQSEEKKQTIHLTWLY